MKLAVVRSIKILALVALFYSGSAVNLHALSAFELSVPAPKLKSSAFVVKNQRTDEMLLVRRADTALPIASITKLMAAMTLIDGHLDMDAGISIEDADVDRLRNSASRLPVGTKLTRQEALHLSLMSSENRAAHALGRTWPGGLTAFVEAMNRKARELGLENTRFVEPTGLSEANVSSALDLIRMAEAAFRYPLIRYLSTRQELLIQNGNQMIRFRSTNSLVEDPDWEVGLSKTGFIRAAGYCLLMQVYVKGEPIIMALLNSATARDRIEDARHIRQWLESSDAQKEQ